MRSFARRDAHCGRGHVGLLERALPCQRFVHDIALHEKDERFRYLLKNGELKKVENDIYEKKIIRY